MDEPVAFENQGQSIYGILSSPEGPKLGAGVVLVHGWTGCRIGPNRLFVNAARYLSSAGFAVLRFDLRGRGDSEGEFDEMDLDAQISDTCAAVDFLKDSVSLSKLAIMGICSGGNVAIGAATLRSDVDALLPLSTLPFQPEQKKIQALKKTSAFAGEYFKKLFRLETWKKLYRGAVNFKMIGKVLFGHLKQPGEGERNPKDSSRDIMADFRDYSGAVLFVYGGADPEAHDSIECFQSFGQEHGLNFQFHVVPKANHNFSSQEWERALLERTRQFLMATFEKT